MSAASANSLIGFLDRHDDKAWAEVVATLSPTIHEVDRDATRIWLSFWPLVIARAFAATKEPDRLARRLALQGRYLLKDQVDTSHAFMYGHRYWPHAKQAVLDAATAGDTGVPLAERVLEVAGRAAQKAGVDRSLVVGITVAAFVTLQHVGIYTFKATPGEVHLDAPARRRSADDVIAARRKKRSAGLFGFLRTVDRRWRVSYDETSSECTFDAINGQDLASAGATDTRDHASRDPRCVEGPIPVECRTAACGTCWVGVLGGAERLSDVDDREWRKMKEFGYFDSDETRPPVRLACRSMTHGDVTIVVPPWNGVFGKLIEGKIAIDEEPAKVE